MTMQPKAFARLAVVDGTENQSTPSNRLNPQQKAAHQRACNLTSRALIAAGGSSIVARKLGKSKQLIADWADPETARALTLRDVVAVGGPFAQSIADQLAAIANEQASPSVSPSAALAVITRLASEVASALADGKLTPEESRSISQQARIAFPVLQSLMKGE